MAHQIKLIVDIMQDLLQIEIKLQQVHILVQVLKPKLQLQLQQPPLHKEVNMDKIILLHHKYIVEIKELKYLKLK